MTPLGRHQIDLLAGLGGIGMTLIVADKVAKSLIRRGLAKSRTKRGCVQITPAGLRALADLLAAGKLRGKTTLPRGKRRRPSEKGSET